MCIGRLNINDFELGCATHLKSQHYYLFIIVFIVHESLHKPHLFSLRMDPQLEPPSTTAPIPIPITHHPCPQKTNMRPTYNHHQTKVTTANHRHPQHIHREIHSPRRIFLHHQRQQEMKAYHNGLDTNHPNSIIRVHILHTTAVQGATRITLHVVVNECIVSTTSHVVTCTDGVYPYCCMLHCLSIVHTRIFI